MIESLRVFRGRDYVINDGIRIRQPNIGEIEEYGEKKYFSLIRGLTATPADRKVEIWDSLHVYWDTVDEYELFASTFGIFQNEDMSILFPGLDFTSFSRVINPKTREVALINKDGVCIDRAIYTLIVDYLRRVHQLKKNRETGYNDITKDCMIEDDRLDYQLAQNKPFMSAILPFASYLALGQRFSDIWEIPVGAFFFVLIRSQKVKNFENLMHGVYSGCVDIKKVNKEDLNWLGEVQ